jgi:hypothetical protein
MSLAQIWPTVQTLSRAEKMRLVQSLVVDLAQEEGIPLIDASISYPIWTPLGADEAAAILQKYLDESELSA